MRPGAEFLVKIVLGENQFLLEIGTSRGSEQQCEENGMDENGEDPLHFQRQLPSNVRTKTLIKQIKEF